MVHCFRVHELTLSLPFDCDELQPTGSESDVDVSVVEGPVPRGLPKAILREPDFEAAPDAFLLRGNARSARFLVENGDTITFERGAACEEPLLVHLLLYQAIAALLRQRGLLVLHASAALSPFGAVIVAGESGAGKSTTIAALTAQGWPLQTDDVAALRQAQGGGVEVLPGASRVHLFADAAAAIDLPTAGLTQHDWHRMKMAVPAPVSPIRCPEPVRRIIILRKGAGPVVRTERLTGRSKLALLTTAYGPLLPDQIARLNPILSRGLQDIDMLVIERPEGAWTLDTVIAAIASPPGNQATARMKDYVA